jgi:hypothetical protein
MVSHLGYTSRENSVKSKQDLLKVSGPALFLHFSPIFLSKKEFHAGQL